MLYDIRWFDTTKTGKLIVRKFQGHAQEFVKEGYYCFPYNGKVQFISKAECIACVWVGDRWQNV